MIRILHVFPIMALVLSMAGCRGDASEGVLSEDLERFELIPDADADCDSFYASKHLGWTSEPFWYDSLEEQFDAVDIVARVRIEAVLPARYWTETGAAPSDPDDHGMAIFRPVVLRVSEVFKGGPAIAGLVAARMGGCDRRLDFEFESSPERLSGKRGDDALLFATHVPDWTEDPPGWAIQLQHAADLRSRPGAPYLQITTSSWIRDFEDSDLIMAAWRGEPSSYDAVLVRLRELSIAATDSND